MYFCITSDLSLILSFPIFQTLSMLFKKKRSLLNSHILHLTFSLVGTVDSGRENTSIPNVSAFEDLLCDLDVSFILNLIYISNKITAIVLALHSIIHI